MAAIRIVHLSDLHFGADLQQREIWISLRNYINDTLKPQLVLITGDIVHTPRKALFIDARDELNDLRVDGPNATDAYRICAGNHDRHFFGNALAALEWIKRRVSRSDTVHAWFDATFGNKIARANNPCDLLLGSSGNSWNVRVIGFDSSVDARYSAQGYATATEIGHIDNTARNSKDFDLVIAMHHHHLLPIRELESNHQALTGILQPTIMLSAGSMLEVLARNHVNLVLHGHEHKAAVAKFGTMTGLKGEVVVVGAGSATGNDSRLGSDLTRASFNLLELKPDRSIDLWQYRHDGINWGPGEQRATTLVTSTDVRRARFLRRVEKSKSFPTSAIKKYIEFSANRNVSISQTWTNRTLTSGHFSDVTINSSGRPLPAQLAFHWTTGEPEIFSAIDFGRDPVSDHTYQLEVTSSRTGGGDLSRIVSRFDWLGGGLLTEEDFNLLPRARGVYRTRGLEFGGVRPPLASDELESMSLLIRLPPAYAPPRESIKVFFHKTAALDEPEYSEELTRALEHHCPGTFFSARGISD